MIYYLDTSFVLTALTPEPTSAQARRWLQDHVGQGVAVSGWVAAEFAAVVNLKQRRGDLTSDGRSTALARFDRFLDRTARQVRVENAHVRVAAQYLRLNSFGLRAPDALHLAIAGALDLVMVTRDARMADAGAGVGVLTSLHP